jgi:sterol desaturase/sphingolipid hydroxylase (fatty acid hydroxylase superfamily)
MNVLVDIQPNFWLYWFIFCGIIIGRYFITAGSIYWLLYSVLGKKPLKSQSKDRFQRRAAILEDIKLSILSAIFFALSAACFMACYNKGFTRVYTHWEIQDLGYLTFSYVTVLLLQDTYFYFMHRLFHLPSLFKWFHQGHHQSKPPTPWTSFAFDPLEAAIQASFLLCIALLVPLHLTVLIALLLTMTVWAVGNHLGIQVIPYSRVSRWCGQWFIGSSYHLVHHRRYARHYGLYFTFWDKVLGTQDIRYEANRLRILETEKQ